MEKLKKRRTINQRAGFRDFSRDNGKCHQSQRRGCLGTRALLSVQVVCYMVYSDVAYRDGCCTGVQIMWRLRPCG